MLDDLIRVGEDLESKTIEGMVGKYFSSVEFEQWVSKVILYLENYHTNSAITEKAKAGFKSLNTNTNYSYYHFLLGSAKAIKEFEKSEETTEFTF